MKFFQPHEVNCRCECGFHPTARAVEKLEALREAWGEPMVINSGARCLAHNKRVGGSPSSYHLAGIAFDVRMPNEKKWAFVELAMDHGWTGVILYKHFVHIDLRPVLYMAPGGY